jgi:L-amino acid N-acyltransferase YncA
MVTIGNASHQDLPEILAIYNEVIRNSTAVFSELEYTPERGRDWFDGKTSSGFPFIVARNDSGVVGFASFGDFRSWPGYRHSVEHSIHVRHDCRGQGVGRTLLIALKARATAMHKHVMIAGIDADNLASIRLHQSLGFINVGQFKEVGFKFGRWLDLVFLQCILAATAE